VLAYLPKPTVPRPRSEIRLALDLALDEAADRPGGNRSMRGLFHSPTLLTAVLLLSAMLAGLTTAVLR
jgi:hypothetical protein